MESLVRFRAAGYEGFGVREGNTVYETESLFAAARGRAHPLGEVRLLTPCAPSKIVCVGRNYVDHAKELGNPVPEEPLIFLKPPSSLIGDGEPIVAPRLSDNVHFEGELALVMGRRARKLREEDAWEHVLGFTCANDVTARDLQRKDGQWTRGKGFDTFCPCGPEIVRRQDVVFEQLRVRTLLDGEVKQDGLVTDMIFSVPRILAYITAFLTLEPGDLVLTGTPAGVGPMRPGQTVTVDIAGVGRLSNPVVAEEA
jgi:2-keto-4-pentenoate hydratase/2-oxohepta-3-ene-1,7-dioic acid hydratase in catechol pathway